MIDYFKPLRRKIGVVTLVVACVFAVGWVRSFSVADTIQLPMEKLTLHAIGSADSCIFWHSNRGHPVEQHKFAWQSIELQPRWSFWSQWDWSILGLSRRNWETGGVLAISYYAIVVPLTLVSVWLLLSKPRAKPCPAQPIASQDMGGNEA